MTEIQLLKFAKGDKIPQDNSMLDYYTEGQIHFVNFYHYQLIFFFAKFWSSYFTVIAWF